MMLDYMKTNWTLRGTMLQYLKGVKGVWLNTISPEPRMVPLAQCHQALFMDKRCLILSQPHP